MMRQHRHLRAIAAVIAAYGLVLQAVLIGLVIGITAAPAADAPPAWAVLCNASGLATTQDGVPAGQKGARTPACCMGGACGLALGLAGAPVVLLPVPVQRIEASLPVEARDLAPQGLRGHLPQARAPPSAAA